MNINMCEHRTQYYETDQMGIIHHSNYVRWFEEARVDMLEKMGMGYSWMETQGVIIPVLEVHAEYKSMTRFGETVLIYCNLKEYNGVRMCLEYSIVDKESGQLRCVGQTKHCFLTRDGKPISLKRNYLEMDKTIREYVTREQG